jgi:hypothetical protein
MTWTEILLYLGFFVQVTANLAVAFYVFSARRQRRLYFFPLLGFSALLGLLPAVLDLTFKRPMSQNDYYWFWITQKTLSIADLMFYAVGIILMARHFRAASRPAASAQPSTKKS